MTPVASDALAGLEMTDAHRKEAGDDDPTGETEGPDVEQAAGGDDA